MERFIEQKETDRMKEIGPLVDCNTVLLVFDSCRFDTAQIAKTPNLDSIGLLRKATTLAPYTPASHFAMFAGHPPTTRDNLRVPFYNESTTQTWRIVTAPSRDANKGCGILLEGTDIIDGHRKLGFHVQGIGGVSQFSKGSALRTLFDWSNFKYFGPNLNEELMQERKPETFELNHIDEIVRKLKPKKKWFTLINLKYTHYPYDSGFGIADEIKTKALPHLGKVLNLRSLKPDVNVNKNALEPFKEQLFSMQVSALEEVDRKLGNLFTELRLITGDRPTFIVAVGDHGDNFGEKRGGTRLWGHLHPTPECLEVPLWIGKL